jgi:hypothetical protein
MIELFKDLKDEERVSVFSYSPSPEASPLKEEIPPYDDSHPLSSVPMSDNKIDISNLNPNNTQTPKGKHTKELTHRSVFSNKSF